MSDKQWQHVCTTSHQRVRRLETLAQFLLSAGERDSFAAVLSAATSDQEQRRRMQLKTLLFGMGETFRVLLQRKRRGVESEGEGPK